MGFFRSNKNVKAKAGLPAHAVPAEHGYDENKPPSDSFVKKSYERQKMGPSKTGGLMNKLKSKFKNMTQKSKMNVDKGKTSNVGTNGIHETSGTMGHTGGAVSMNSGSYNTHTGDSTMGGNVQTL